MSLSTGLLAFYRAGSGSNDIPDLSPLAGPSLIATGGATITDLGGGVFEARDGAAAHRWVANASASQQPSGDWSVAYHGTFLAGAISGSPLAFGCAFTNSNTSPFLAWGSVIRDTATATLIRIMLNQGGTFRNQSLSGFVTIGTVFIGVLTYQASSGQLTCYVDGTQTGQTTLPGTGGPTYGTTPQIIVGTGLTLTDRAFSGMRRGMLWNRVLSAAEVSTLASNPDAPITPIVPRVRTMLFVT